MTLNSYHLNFNKTSFLFERIIEYCNKTLVNHLEIGIELKITHRPLRYVLPF